MDHLGEGSPEIQLVWGTATKFASADSNVLGGLFSVRELDGTEEGCRTTQEKLVAFVYELPIELFLADSMDACVLRIRACYLDA